MAESTSWLGRLIGSRAFHRQVLAVALPVMIHQLIMSSMGFVDSVMVGQINAESLAGVVVTNRFFLVMQAMLFGVTSGAGIFIAQYFGASDHEKSQGFFALSICGSLTVAGFFLILISIMPERILSLFITNPVTIEAGLNYLFFIRFSYLPYAISLACMTALRSIGLSRPPMLIGTMAIILNTSLNYILIFGHFGFPEMGVRGAGLATLTARCFEMILYLTLIVRGRHYFKSQFRQIRSLNQPIIKMAVGRFVPLISNELFWSLGMAVLFWTYAQVDERFIASLAIVEMTSNINFVIFSGLGAAVSVLVGTRLGRGSYDEARANAGHLIALAVVFTLAWGTVVFALSGYIPGLFNVRDEISTTASQMLRINACFYAVITLNVSIFFMLRTGGETRSTLIIDSGFIWLFVIPVAVTLSQTVRPPMVVFYLVLQAAELLKLLLGFWFYRRGRWIRNLT
jgi:putative MATE family efflux protein